MRNEMVQASLFLNAVLPQIEEIAAFDQEFQEAVKGWKCSIQFHVSGGPAVCLYFDKGKVTSKLEAMSLPSIAMWFPSPEAANKMFEKSGFSIPIIWKGIWHPVILAKFTKLTEKIEYYLKPTEAMLKDEKIFNFHVRLMLMVAVYGIKAIGENDPAVKDLVAHTPNGTMELRVLPDGPVAHIILKDGKFTPVKGPAKDPTVSMEINGNKLAYDLLNGKVDAMGALGSREIAMHGLLPLADNLNVVMERIGKYLQ
jgi:hypothetical protein